MAITTVSSHVVSVNAIQGTLIADNAITAVHIATNAVSGTLIADNAVTAVHIAQNSITVTQLADDCVESDKIADGVITTNHLNKAMISSQTEVTPVAGDFVLLGDTSDSNNLKKAPLTLLLNSNVDISGKADLAGPTFTGDVDIDGSDDLRLRFLNGSTFKGGIQVPTSTGDMISGAAVDDLAIRSQANMLFSTGGNTERMRIDSSGDVFIPGDMTLGSSSSNPGQLFLNDGSSQAYTLGIIGTGTRAFELKGSDSDADYNTTFSNHANGNHNLIADGSITSTTNAALALDLAGTHSNGNYISFRKGGAVQHFIGTSDSVGGGSNFYDYYSISGIGQRFWTGASERMRIYSTGEVHITSAGSPIAPTIKHGGGVGDYAKLRIINRSGQGADKGGLLELGAITNDGVTRSDVFAALHGGKDNSTSGNKAGYMGFHTSNGSSLDYRMRLTSNGELLMGDTTLRGSIQRGQIQVTQIDSNNAAGISCISGNDEIAGTFCLYSSGTASAMISVDPDQNRASSNFYIHIDGAQKAILDSGGNFTITGSYGSSDRALKENIVTLPSQLETVKQLNPVSFDWKERAEDGSTESSIGFIAQEVEELYPNLIRTPLADSDAEEASTTQYKSLNYAVMVSILTKAIQEQQAIIESLKTRLDNAGL